MKNYSDYFTRATAILLLLILGSSPGFGSPLYLYTFEGEKPSAPMTVDLSLRGPLSLGQTGEVIFNVTPFVSAPNTEIKVLLPEGFSVVNGDLSWTGDVDAGQTIEIRVEVKAEKVGNWTIEGHAISRSYNDFFGKSDFVYISISEDGSIVISKTKLSAIPNVQVEQIQSVEQSSVNQSSPGTVTVYGWWYFYEEDGVTLRSAKYIKVELYDSDWWGNTLLATTSTDVNGYYQFPAIENNDGIGEDGYDVFVRGYSDTAAVKVMNDAGSVYYGDTGKHGNVPDGSHSMGSWIFIGDNRGAWGILDTCVTGYQYANSLGHVHPKVELFWPSGGTYVESGNGYRIHAVWCDQWDEDVLLHEYGHSVQYNVYGGWIPNTGGPHSWNQHTNPNFAWSEGWPTFFGVTAARERGYGDSLFPKDSLYRDTHDQFITHDLETDPHEHGDDVEGAIACILWDIYDSSNDGLDMLSSGMSPIWDVFRNYITGGHHLYTIHEFWDGWFARGHNYRSQMNAIFWEHGVDKNEVPSCSITSPNTGGWYSGVIAIAGSASDIDGSVSQVVFQYSTEGSSWNYIGTDYSAPWGVSWDTSFIGADSSVWVRAHAYDNMEWGDWDACDQSFGVDNSPPNNPTVSETHCGSSWTTHNSPYFTWGNPGDSGSGISYYQGSMDGGAPFTVSSPYHPTWSDGIHTFKVRAVDGVGLPSGWSNVITVKIDTTPPAGSISINAGATYTTSTSVTLSLSALDGSGSGVVSTCFSNDGSTWTAWEDYATSKSWTLTSGDGTKTVYVKYRDYVGLESSPPSYDTIILDATPPSTPTPSSPSDGSTTSNNRPTFTWYPATDITSGVASYTLQIDTSVTFDSANLREITEIATTSYTPTTPLSDGIWYWRVRATDNAGNPSSWSNIWSLKIQTGPPTYDVTINAHCNTEGVDVSVSFTWDGTPYATPQAFPGQTGSHTVVIAENDGNGHPFIKWVKDGTDYSTSRTITISSGRTYTAIYAAAIYNIHLESEEDTGATTNLGTITLDGTPYPLPTDISKEAGSYPVTYNPESNYKFDHWERSGGISVVDTSAQTTAVVVSGDGTLTAIYTYISAPVANLIVEVYNSTGQPAEYTQIYSNDPEWIWEETDENGRLELNVTAGTYTICAFSSSYDFALFETGITVTETETTTVIFDASTGTVPATVKVKSISGIDLEYAEVFFALEGTTMNPWIYATDSKGEIKVRVYPATYHVGVWKWADEAYYLYKPNVPIAIPTTILFEPTTAMESILHFNLNKVIPEQYVWFAPWPRSISVDWAPVYSPSTVIFTPDTYDTWIQIRTETTDAIWDYDLGDFTMTFAPGSSSTFDLGGHLDLTLDAGENYKPGQRVPIHWNLTDSYGHEIYSIDKYTYPEGTAAGMDYFGTIVTRKEGIEKVGTEMLEANEWIDVYPRLEILDPSGKVLVNQTIEWYQKPYNYALNSDARSGTYTTRIVVETGPYEGKMIEEDQFTVGANAYLVVRSSTNKIIYRIYNSTSDSWGGWKTLPGATCDAPAAAVCQNELYIVVRSLNGKALFHGYVDLDTDTFSGWTRIGGSTPSPPTLASNGTALYLVIRATNNRIQYRSYDFTLRSWGSWNVVPKGTTSDGPAAAMLGNDLHIVVRGFSSTNVNVNYTLWHIILRPNIGVVRDWIKISGTTPSKPALAANAAANKLYLVVRRSTNRIDYRTYDANTDSWGSWIPLPKGSTCDGPGATVCGNNLHIVVRSLNGKALFHGYVDLATGKFRSDGWKQISGSTPSPPTLAS